jgi:hypothetical protein
LAYVGLPTWYWITYDGDYTGYIGSNNVNKKVMKETGYPEEIKELVYAYDNDGYPITASSGDGETITYEYQTIK